MKKVFISLFLFMSTMAIHAQQADFNVVPLPQQVKLTAKPSFKLSNATRIAYPEGSEEMELPSLQSKLHRKRMLFS